MCMNILINNIDGKIFSSTNEVILFLAIYEVGGIPFFILEPVLVKLVT